MKNVYFEYNDLVPHMYFFIKLYTIFGCFIYCAVVHILESQFLPGQCLALLLNLSVSLHVCICMYVWINALHAVIVLFFAQLFMSWKANFCPGNILHFHLVYQSIYTQIFVFMYVYLWNLCINNEEKFCSLILFLQNYS